MCIVSCLKLTSVAFKSQWKLANQANLVIYDIQIIFKKMVITRPYDRN
jgi:catabolite regulation protein CreA